MRIGIDIDDTICDTFDFVLPYCCKYYGVDYEKAISQKYFSVRNPMHCPILWRKC